MTDTPRRDATIVGQAFDAGYAAAIADVVQWLKRFHKLNDFPMSSAAVLKAIESGSWKETKP